jgi:hypothetical protein
MLNSSLSAGSVKYYVKFILPTIGRTPGTYDLLAACDKAHADEETTSAAPFSTEELRAFLAQLSSHKTFFGLMSVTGCDTSTSAICDAAN